MEPLNGKNVPAPLQRATSIKRAVLIPQVTNLKFGSSTDLEALANQSLVDLKPKKSNSRLKSFNNNHKSERSMGIPLPNSTSSGSSLFLTAQQPSGRDLLINDSEDDYDKDHGPVQRIDGSGSINHITSKEKNDFVEKFLENVPKVSLSREDSQLMRTRVIEEMYRIQERAQITQQERQRLFQIAMTMDAPKLARKLVSEAKEQHTENRHINENGGGAFLTGEIATAPRNKHSNSRSSYGEKETKERKRSDSLKSNEDDVSLSSSQQLQQQQHHQPELNEDELFCKAFDEVERIRKRILHRVSDKPSGSLSPVNRSHHQNQNHPRSFEEGKESDTNGFENITIPLKRGSSFRSDNSGRTPLIPPSSKSPKPTTDNKGNHNSFPKVFPETASSSNHQQHQNTGQKSHLQIHPKTELHSLHSPRVSNSIDIDLAVTHVIDSLIGPSSESGSNSRQSSRRGFDVDNSHHGKPSTLITKRSFREKGGDDYTVGIDSPFLDPFMKADRKNLKRMNSSLLRSAENELKMIKDKIDNYDNISDDEGHDKTHNSHTLYSQNNGYSENNNHEKSQQLSSGNSTKFGLSTGK
jgi:hypothetical protein